MTNQKTIYIYYANHFDLVWRRAWKRSYEHNGLVYRGYADLEELIISRCIKLAREHGAAFQIEQGLSLREYLRRHPEYLPTLRELVREGRFELLGSGETIIDSNMCDGETLTRNYASGIRYAKETLGQDTPLAYHFDGFGSSAQLPQIVRRCGMRGIQDLSYCKPDAPYWRGLDGSTVLAQFEMPGQFWFLDHCYYESCLICKGYGEAKGASCGTCAGTGLRLSQGTFPSRPWEPDASSPIGHYCVCSEEMVPDETLPNFVRERNATGPERMEWKSRRAMMPLWEDALNRVDDPDVPLSSSNENNPIQTGTLVSRIRVKQKVRQAEGCYYAAEKLAVLASLATGKPEDAAAFEALWLEFPLLFFHDAVTGTHIDPAYDEIMDLAGSVIADSRQLALSSAQDILPNVEAIAKWPDSGVIAVFNPNDRPASLSVEIPASGDGFEVTDSGGHSVPIYNEPSRMILDAPGVTDLGPAYWALRGEEPPKTLRFLAQNLPAFGVGVFTVTTKTADTPTALSSSVNFAGYEMGWDDCGVTSLRDRSSGQELLDQSSGSLAHLVLEGDIGDPWGTRSFERPRTFCTAMSRLVGARQWRDSVEVVFSGSLENGTFGREDNPQVFGLSWYQTVRILRGLPWVEVEMEVFWQAVDHRIRVAFPSRSISDRGVYKIPYGVLERDRYEMTDNFLWAPNGDWPATYFAATLPSDTAPGLAVLNAGTPSVRIEDGTLYYSVLRSPGFGHCLNRYAQEYPMPVSGMRDGGHHSFRFAVMPYTGDNLPQILQAGYEFNSQALAWRAQASTKEWAGCLSLNEPGVHIASVKRAFDRQGITLRIVEQLGQTREVTVNVPANITRASIANLLEEPEQELPIEGNRVRVPVTPYSINTVVLHS